MVMKLDARQASMVYKYINIKVKLLKTNMHIKFNKKCLIHNIIPKYCTIHIKNTSIAASKTKQIAEIKWIKEEIKQLYSKKAKLNHLLYRTNLEMLNMIHPVLLPNAKDYINDHITKTMFPIIQRHDKKIYNLIAKQHKDENIKCKHTFSSRIANLTNIKFDKNELELLNKGLKYNLPHRNSKHQITRELIQTEAVIKTLPTQKSQNETRILVNDKLKKVFNTQRINKLLPQHMTPSYANELRIINNIKEKVKNNNAMVTRADKSNATVIITKQLYQEKVHQFILDNNIKKLDKDPTQIFVKNINNAINKCTNLFKDNSGKHLKQINAQAPKFTGLPKLHKTNIPIRPLVNYTTAPGYKVAKKLTEIIKNNIIIQNDNSISNSMHLINITKDIRIENNYKLASFDITNLYTNVPTQKTIEILKNNLENTGKLEQHIINELLYILDKILKQNYFTYNNEFYIQEKGLAMGSPLSGILAEVYLNHFENTHLITENNKFKNQIILYKRYVDDTFIIFDGTARQLEKLKTYMNSVDHQIQFTAEIEQKQEINYLDITIQKHNNRFQYKIYRKPTATDSVIHASSYHPYTQKMAAFNSLVYRLTNIPLKYEDYMEEVNTIKYVAVKNGYSSSIIDKLIRKYKHNKKTINKEINANTQRKYISTEYTKNTAATLQNIFKKHNIMMTFRTTNNIQRLLHPKIPKDNKEKTGVYKLTCDDCEGFYIGQSGRPLFQRFKEHVPKGSVNNNKSNYAKHLILKNHNYTDFSNNCKVLHTCNKGRYMYAAEELEIYRGFKNDPNNILNDQLDFKSNQIYDTIIDNN